MEAPEFLARAAEYRERWRAERQAALDRPTDPSGSFRSRGGFYLSPERHAEAVAAIGRVRKAEPAVSADTRTVEQENRHGGWLEGFERRLKDDDRLKEKIAEKLEAEPRMLVGEALPEVADAIRFTYCFQPENYASGHYGIKQRLESRGYEMYHSKNSSCVDVIQGDQGEPGVRCRPQVVVESGGGVAGEDAAAGVVTGGTGTSSPSV